MQERRPSVISSGSQADTHPAQRSYRSITFNKGVGRASTGSERSETTTSKIQNTLAEILLPTAL